MNRCLTLLSLTTFGLTALTACGSAPPRADAEGTLAPDPALTPGSDTGADLATPAWYTALFVAGASARFAVHEDRHAVTDEAVQRGGPESAADWVVTPSDGEITCEVASVRTVGEAQVSLVTCSGYEIAGLVAPPAGLWVLLGGALYHSYYAEMDDAAIAALATDGRFPILPSVPTVGARATEEVQVTLELRGTRLCATETALMGDDYGTSTCFERGAWPASFDTGGGAAWQYSEAYLKRL